MILQAIGLKQAGDKWADSASALLLDDSRAARQRLLAAMAVVESLASQDQADRSSYANARLGISQCSPARRALWGRIFRHLLPRATARAASEFGDAAKFRRGIATRILKPCRDLGFGRHRERLLSLLRCFARNQISNERLHRTGNAHPLSLARAGRPMLLLPCPRLWRVLKPNHD